MYPVMLSVRSKSCLVVGGGGVALRKVLGLLAEGAEVTVVATEVVDEIAALAQEGRIQLRQQQYPANMAGSGFALVFAATDDRQINRQVFEDAQKASVWVNVADDPELCSFHLPARIQRGAFQLAIASAGEAPFVVRRMRQLLEQRLGPEWASWAEAAASFRNQVRTAQLDLATQEWCYDQFFDASVNRAKITARVLSQETLDQILCQAEQRDRSAATHKPASSQPNVCRETATGFVSLVGSGPGDPGLLTLRARNRLVAADAVVYDRLAAAALPCDLKPGVELYSVGKKAAHHSVPQDEINQLLVRLAQSGQRVVRLKGGDPFVFGRGGEEAQALAAANVVFEVVPAVTAGVAVPAYAGIPVTHRRTAVRLTLVTAHEAQKEEGPQVRWDLLAPDPHATIVGYMGVSSLPKVVQRLVAAGMAPDMPAALIQQGSTAAQKSVISDLTHLVQAGQEAGIRPPAIFVIGPTVSLSEQLDWYRTKPLAGQRLVVPKDQPGLIDALEFAGAQLVPIQHPITDAVRVVMSAVPLTGCVLADPVQVDAVDELRDGAGWHPDVVAWCLSASVYQRACELGWTRVELVTDQGDGRSLIEALTRLRQE